MKKIILNNGWVTNLNPSAYIMFASDQKSALVEHYQLLVGNYFSLSIEKHPEKFCTGYYLPSGKYIPCPTTGIVESGIRCIECSKKDFYSCRALCKGDYCKSINDQERVHCASTLVSIYLTSVAGKIKVGSSTNPLRRWLDQGSDAGIVIAKGKWLTPRALEYLIGNKFHYSMAVRTTQKLINIGKQLNFELIDKILTRAIEDIYQNMKSEILIPREKISEITHLDKYYGNIPKLNTQPIIKTINLSGLEFIGEIIGVKGSIIVVKNNKTLYSCDLNSLIGYKAFIKEEISEMKGQKSLSDFY